MYKKICDTQNTILLQTRQLNESFVNVQYMGTVHKRNLCDTQKTIKKNTKYGIKLNTYHISAYHLECHKPYLRY